MELFPIIYATDLPRRRAISCTVRHLESACRVALTTLCPQREGPTGLEGLQMTLTFKQQVRGLAVTVIAAGCHRGWTGRHDARSTFCDPLGCPAWRTTTPISPSGSRRPWRTCSASCSGGPRRSSRTPATARSPTCTGSTRAGPGAGGESRSRVRRPCVMRPRNLRPAIAVL